MNLNREIITLQFGHFSNYIGAHWWNIQESAFSYDSDEAGSSEIDNDVLYREGVDFKRQTTYTPRLLLVDLHGSLRHLPEEGTLYGTAGPSLVADDIEDDEFQDVKGIIPWDNSDIKVIKKEKANKPDFQRDLDNPEVDIDGKSYEMTDNVQTWTDYLYARYHPRTINMIKEYEHSSQIEEFDTFTNGARLFETPQFENDFCDRIRQYIEECNNCQGFQTIFDSTNGFSGLSSKCLEYLNDEYSKANFCIPVFTPRRNLFKSADDAMTDTIRVVNTALTFSNLIEQSSLFLPLSTNERDWRQIGAPRKFPFVNFKNDNLYQSSAILASYLDTITLRYRLKNPGPSNYLSGFCSDLTNYGRKLTAAALSLPFKMRHDQDLIDCLDQQNESIFTQLSPNTKIGTNYIVQSVCVRGIPKTRLKKPLKSAQKQMKMSAYKCESVSEMFQLYFQCENHASIAHVSAIQAPLPLRTPYPMEIFDSRINFEGYVSDTIRPDEQKILSMPTVASIQCSGDLADTIETLHREASRIKINKLHRFKETGLEPDDYPDILESLLQFKDNYEDNFDL